MPKRDQTPPYEIMRGRARGGSVARGGESESVVNEKAAAASDELGNEESVAASGAGPWWVGSSSPLVLRVPRGLALLAIGGLIVLVVVAYWVGTVRGAAGVERIESDALAIDRPGPAGWFEADDAVYDGPIVLPPDEVLFKDVREPGLWYLRLMSTSSPDDARKLAEFMQARGVAMQLVMSNNGRSCVAYAIDRGYRTDEKDGPAAQYYLSRMRQLGRLWKQENGGRGDDLSSMYYAQARRPDASNN